MQTPSDDSRAVPAAAWAYRPEEPPRVIIAAAMITWVGASLTAIFALGSGVVILLLGAPILEDFEDRHLAWYIAAAVMTVVAFSAAGGISALFVTRRHGWARWMLVGLSAIAAACGIVMAYYVVPLMITLAGVTVIVLLFRPPARAWFGESRL